MQEKAKIHATRYNYAGNTNSDYSSIWSSFSYPGFFCKMTKPSSTCAKGMNSSVASSARSVVPSRTGVECVWKPDIVLGLPACPTTSTAYEHAWVSQEWKTEPNSTHLADTDGDREALQFLVECNEEPRVHRGHEEVQHPMVLVEHDCQAMGVSVRQSSTAHCDSQLFASVNASNVASKPATAVLLMILRSEKKGLMVSVPLPMCTRPWAMRTMNRQSGSL